MFFVVNGYTMKIILLCFICFSSVYSAVGMKESTMIVKKDYGNIIYAEDLYRLYSLPMNYTEIDLFENIKYLEMALDAPFGFANRAFAIITTEESYQKYKDLLHMQFRYLITQNYIYLAGLYDKPNYYFYNDQFKGDIEKSLEYARYFYLLSQESWVGVKEYAEKVTSNKANLEMDRLIDNAYKIKYGEIDYDKTASRKLKELEEKLLAIRS